MQKLTILANEGAIWYPRGVFYETPQGIFERQDGSPGWFEGRIVNFCLESLALSVAKTDDSPTRGGIQAIQAIK